MPENLRVGDLVQISVPEDGTEEQHLLYDKFCAQVIDIHDRTIDLDSDGYTRKTGGIQAVSFRACLPTAWVKKNQFYGESNSN